MRIFLFTVIITQSRNSKCAYWGVRFPTAKFEIFVEREVMVYWWDRQNTDYVVRGETGWLYTETREYDSYYTWPRCPTSARGWATQTQVSSLTSCTTVEYQVSVLYCMHGSGGAYLHWRVQDFNPPQILSPGEITNFGCSCLSKPSFFTKYFHTFPCSHSYSCITLLVAGLKCPPAAVWILCILSLVYCLFCTMAVHLL